MYGGDRRDEVKTIARFAQKNGTIFWFMDPSMKNSFRS
jgi:hypothetical protein